MEKIINIKALRKKAEAIAKNDLLLKGVVVKAFKKADEQHGKIKEWWGDIKTLIRLVQAWAKKEYRIVPWTSVIVAVMAILYFLNPFDFIPDFVLLGFTDDAVVVAAALSSIKSDLEAFREWEKSKK